MTEERIAAPSLSGDEARRLLAPLAPYQTIVLAVSGGVDSLALLHLVADARDIFCGRALFVATIDHSLRQGSAGEAAFVAEVANKLGLPHRIMTWSAAKPSTGIMDAARDARYRLLADFAFEMARGHPAAIVTAHHRDDQVETFLMRLARGSGLDGLAGMSMIRRFDSARRIDIVRPLLGIPKARLAAAMHARGERWIDDPSNEQAKFERVRLRQAESALSALGLTPEAIALAVQRLGAARAALDFACETLENDVVVHGQPGLYTEVDRLAFNVAPRDLQVRLLRRLLNRHGGASSPAQLSEIESLAGHLSQTTSMASTLGGAIVSAGSRRMRVYREPGRIDDCRILAPGDCVTWDGRFIVSSNIKAGFIADVRPLGVHGLQQMRRGGVYIPAFPARALEGLPAIWREKVLVACPVLGPMAAAAEHWSEDSPWRLSELFTAEAADKENA